MTYSVNGHAPYFGSGKEARAYALANPESIYDVDWQDSKAGVMEIRCDGITVGTVLLPPEGKADFCAYWAPEDGVVAYPLSDDGSYDPEDIFQICFEPRIWLHPRFFQADGEANDFGGKVIGFENEERAYSWFYHQAGLGVEASVVDADGKERGVLHKLPVGPPTGDSGAVVLISKKKCREVFPTGRLGKPFDMGSYIREVENMGGRGLSIRCLGGSDYEIKIDREEAFREKYRRVEAVLNDIKGDERMYDVERGIHYKPRRAMDRLPGSEVPAVQDAPAEQAVAVPVQTDAPKASTESMSLTNIRGCQIVYGILLTKGRMNYASIGNACGRSTYWVKCHVTMLKGLGLVETVKTGPAVQSPVECYVLADAPLPDGWNVDEMIAMAQSQRPAEKKDAPSVGSKPFGAHVAKAFSGDPVVLEKAMPTYQAFYEDLRNLPDYPVPEIRGIIQDLMELCRKRLKNVHYECPVCKGTLKRVGNEVRCEGRCKISVGAPDLESAMKYMRLIAEAKRRDDE